ncbi:hypothetical protein [Proteiniborus sp. MB09-C3]|uniref:hypothetical protein n=1 Tax=Proteiniborus sp. MB09-C3 TaxID=3050072 RepID=UPI002552F777|nr:hypothetical protein [Proteiniborus sp. MB09-C3]WIV10656.1 hypothetical protein QO263_10855 [Proteiniborus sp. MB09-C3]
MIKNKNHLLPIILVLFIACLFTFKIYYSSVTDDLVFNQIGVFNNILSKKLVDNFFSENSDIKELSTNSIKKIVLKDLGYENWLNYIEFIDIYLYPFDIIHDNVEDLIISVNLSKDQGVIGIYRLYEDRYILSNIIKDLCNIKNVSAIRIESSKKSFIVTEEILDEMIGAYFIDNFVRVFSETDGEFIEVFRQSIDYTAYYFEKWSDPETPEPKWYKITDSSVVDNINLEKENIIINVSKTLSKYESLDSSSFSASSDYKLIGQNSFDVKLVWSEPYNSFIMSEGKIISQNTEVGILEDTTQTVDYLLNLTGKYYKVIDKNKRIFYIKNDDIMIIKDFSTL